MRYIEHSDMCGCERCALKFEAGIKTLTFDVVDDDNYKDCGCPIDSHCSCDDDFLEDD